MQQIRAKMRVERVEESVFNKGTEHEVKDGERVQLSAVYSDDPTNENHSYSQATPSASLDMYISNPGAFGFFEQGKEYLIDFTEAE